MKRRFWRTYPQAITVVVGAPVRAIRDGMAMPTGVGGPVGIGAGTPSLGLGTGGEELTRLRDEVGRQGYVTNDVTSGDLSRRRRWVSTTFPSTSLLTWALV